jgi:hypothetical protein
MQAVAISVANKRAMADELRRVLRAGGRLAFFDSYARSGDELHFPLPWADGPEASFVVSAGELRSVFEAVGSDSSRQCCAPSDLTPARQSSGPVKPERPAAMDEKR